MRVRIVVGCAFLALAGCIDLEGAYAACLDAGTCGDAGQVTPDSGADAGRVDAGEGLDAGTDAGPNDAGSTEDGGVVDAGEPDGGETDAGVPDAGTPDAGTPDAGASCPGSPRKLLRCAPPIALDAGGPNVHFGALSANPQGFLVGLARDLIVVNQVNFDAGVSFVFSRPKQDGGIYTNAHLSLDTQGSSWLAVWLEPGDDHALCMTSRDGTTNQVRVQTGGLLSRVDAALSPDGGIAVVAVRQSVGAPVVGAQGASCPAGLSTLPFPGTASGASVVWTNDGFRYVYSGLGGQTAGSSSGRVMVGTLVDGGSGGYLSTTSRPAQNEAIATTAGDEVMVVVNSATSNLVSLIGANAAGTFGAPIDLTYAKPASWVVSRCGADCVVGAVVPYETLQPVTLTFFTDGTSPSATGSWDLLCDTPGAAVSRTTLALATSGGKLGALVTTPSSASLLICDLPPGPP